MTMRQLFMPVAAGIAGNALLDFEPVDFSADLVPVTPLKLPDATPGDFGFSGRHFGTRNFYLWLEKPGEIRLKVMGGITYRDRGPIRLELFSPRNVLEEPEDRDFDTVQPDEEWHEVVLHTPHDGLHRLHTSGGGGRHLIEFPDDLPVCLRLMTVPNYLAREPRLLLLLLLLLPREVVEADARQADD